MLFSASGRLTKFKNILYCNEDIVAANRIKVLYSKCKAEGRILELSPATKPRKEKYRGQHTEPLAGSYSSTFLLG